MPAGGPGWAPVVWLHSKPGPCPVILVTLPQAGNTLASLTFRGTWESRLMTANGHRALPPCGRGCQLQEWAGQGQGLPERLGLDVLDHDGVDELPPAVVVAEPACHIPRGKRHTGGPQGWVQGSLRWVFSSTCEVISESPRHLNKLFSPQEAWCRKGRPSPWGCVGGCCSCPLTCPSAASRPQSCAGAG